MPPPQSTVVEILSCNELQFVSDAHYLAHYRAVFLKVIITVIVPPRSERVNVAMSQIGPVITDSNHER